MSETNNNLQNFEAAYDFIKNHSTFIMATHAHTDGDDLGSMLAMHQVLKSMGKHSVPVANGGVPAGLKFLPQQNEVLENVQEDNFDAIILFGCSNVGRTELEKIMAGGLPILNIDHHPDNKLFGGVNLVDKNKSSVAELIYDFIKFIGAELTTDISKCLLTGMFTDTGSFMHSNTQASTLNAAAELLKNGVRIDKIYSSTYKGNKDENVLKAWAKAIENTRIDNENQIVLSVVTEDDLKDIGDLPEDCFGGFIDNLNSIPNTKFSIFIRQEGEFIKGSIRSEERKNIDVSALAKLFGGGGHKLASGFKMKGKIHRDLQGAWRVEEN